ncbi:MAG: ATP-dependent 6-phosphofructokinase [Rickettsiales bacterium]|jgi:6-phosphofructokinase 1|nr:ATP-dependent 6-phosphofructokinase [Rickettsiales bacterium]
MADKKKRIGVFTSGGDCAGLNMAITAVVKAGIEKHGWEMVGICDGQEGLMAEAPSIALDRRYPFDDVIRQGGSFLGAFNRSNNNTEYLGEVEMIRSLTARFVEGVRKLKLDGLIGTGGNGGLLFISQFAKAAGLPFVGIPKTVDNDVPHTDVCLGFDSAVNVCMGAMDNIYWTAKSHRRAIITEVMGRDTGHLAMHAGVAAAVDIVLVPEIPYTIKGILAKIEDIRRNEGKRHFLIITAEGAGAENGKRLKAHAKHGGVAQYIEENLVAAGIKCRSNELGYMQRGSVPTSYDRNLAAIFGAYAVDVFASGARSAMVARRNGRLASVDLGKYDKARTRYLSAKSDIVKAAQGLGIYIGNIK